MFILVLQQILLSGNDVSSNKTPMQNRPSALQQPSSAIMVIILQKRTRSGKLRRKDKVRGLKRLIFNLLDNHKVIFLGNDL